MKKIVGLMVCAAVMLSVMCFTTFAADANVAKIGDTEYATLPEAIAAVEDGGTIQLIAGEISEAVALGRVEKSFTLVGAANYETVFKADLKIGTDNSSWPTIEKTIVVKNITFNGAGLYFADVRNVVVEGNKFSNLTDGKSAIVILDAAIDGNEASAIVKGNYINGAEQGIRIRTGYNVEISNNTIENTQHNAITLEHATKWPANNGKVIITDNTIKNWALGGEGRVVRATFGNAATLAKEISFIGNKMLRQEEPAEEYAKITNVGTVAVNLEKNYWNSESPNFNKIVLVEGANANVNITEYYKAETLKLEDLNTYVAPPVEEDNTEDKKEDEKIEDKKQEKTENVEEVKKEETKKENTSPKTSDSLMTVATLVMSAATLLVSACKIVKI